MNKSVLAITLAGLYAGNAIAANKVDSPTPVAVISAEDIASMPIPSAADMWKIIQQQNAELVRLRGNQQQTDAKVEATVDAVENSSLASAAEWVNKTSVGGYGEIHYNNLEGKNGQSDKDQIDNHRFVLFFGHQFTDDVRFFSELEVEHGFIADTDDGDTGGEVEVEQAFIEWDFAENHSTKIGQFLIPVGIMNETHEPDTFYGVERNLVEKNIIPVTWWEAGVGVNGQITDGLSYDVAVHSGLDAADGNIRSGRQKVSKANADSGAITGRIKYTGIQGLELAATVQHQQDLSQDSAPAIEATLFEAHAVYQTGPLTVKALYAMWDIDEAVGSGRDEQEGYYIEPSYKLTENLGVFARYSMWDTQAGDSLIDSEKKQTDIGVNYWLTQGVVLKADYQNEDMPAGQDRDGINLGVGWSF